MNDLLYDNAPMVGTHYLCNQIHYSK